MYDLHTHSTCSDGTEPPERVVELGAEAGLAGLALTDHDTTEGWRVAAAACSAYGLEFVPGLELSAETAGRSVHVLGYWVDPTQAALATECRRLRDERAERMRATVRRLAQLGVSVSEEAVRRAAGEAPLGRPHVAAALVEAGVVADIDEAFAAYLHDGGPAYVPKHALAPVAAARLIVDAGGVAVLAHPGLYGDEGEGVSETALAELAAVGLTGVEADHPAHTPDQVRHWSALARAHGLEVTGSSDFHGARKEAKIAARTTSPETVEALRARLPAGETSRRTAS